MAEVDPATVTVVIPTFDRGHLVERALDSVLAQTVEPDAVVVVDDGSTDDTLHRLERYGDALTVIAQTNQGASEARNRGVAEASTSWVAFCDSDDRWEPDHLEQVLTAIRGTAGTAALYFDDLVLEGPGAGGTSFEAAGLALQSPWEVAGPVARWLTGSWQPMLLQSSLIRVTTYRALGGLAPELRVRHDTHLFFRIGFEHPMCAVAGVGGALCADAGPGGRLTDHRDERGSAFWQETLWLYHDLLGEAPDPAVRRHLERRLAATHVKVGMADLRGRRPRSGLGHLAKAITGSPAAVAQQVGRAVRKRLASPVVDGGP